MHYMTDTEMMVYDYSRPRVPIAATYTGPGPRYALPGLIGRERHDPCSRFAKAPSYPFGTKPCCYADDRERSIGPGPCYNPQAKVHRTMNNNLLHVCKDSCVVGFVHASVSIIHSISQYVEQLVFRQSSDFGMDLVHVLCTPYDFSQYKDGVIKLSYL